MIDSFSRPFTNQSERRTKIGCGGTRKASTSSRPTNNNNIKTSNNNNNNSATTGGAAAAPFSTMVHVVIRPGLEAAARVGLTLPSDITVMRALEFVWDRVTARRDQNGSLWSSLPSYAPKDYCLVVCEDDLFDDGVVPRTFIPLDVTAVLKKQLTISNNTNNNNKNKNRHLSLVLHPSFLLQEDCLDEEETERRGTALDEAHARKYLRGLVAEEHDAAVRRQHVREYWEQRSCVLSSLEAANRQRHLLEEESARRTISDKFGKANAPLLALHRSWRIQRQRLMNAHEEAWRSCRSSCAAIETDDDADAPPVLRQHFTFVEPNPVGGMKTTVEPTSHLRGLRRVLNDVDAHRRDLATKRKSSAQRQREKMKVAVACGGARIPFTAAAATPCSANNPITSSSPNPVAEDLIVHLRRCRRLPDRPSRPHHLH
eukprot:PhM_4_TR1065/c0_g1_i1/m.83417